MTKDLSPKLDSLMTSISTYFNFSCSKFLCLYCVLSWKKIADLDRYSNHVNKEKFFSYSGRVIEINQNLALSHFTVYIANPTVSQRIHRQHSNNSIVYEIDSDQAIVSDIIFARKGYVIVKFNFGTFLRLKTIVFS